MNFITHFLATWVDIFLGFCFLAVILFFSYSISAYVSRREEKRDISEFEKMREAMRNK